MKNRDLVLLEALKTRLAEVEQLIIKNNFERDQKSDAEEHYADAWNGAGEDLGQVDLRLRGPEVR